MTTRLVFGEKVMPWVIKSQNVTLGALVLLFLLGFRRRSLLFLHFLGFLDVFRTLGAHIGLPH